MLYTSTHLAAIFHVSTETIRNWTEEFSDYLSVTANPGKGRTRNFTEPDLEVFALIDELKKGGSTFADIRASLSNGQRGHAPPLSVTEVRTLISSEQEKRLTLEIEILQRELGNALARAKEAEAIKTENIQLRAQLDASEQRLQEVMAQLREAHEAGEKALREAMKRTEELSRQVGEMSGQSYVKGFMEGLAHSDNKPATD